MWLIKEIILVGRVSRIDKTNVNNVLIVHLEEKESLGDLDVYEGVMLKWNFLEEDMNICCQCSRQSPVASGEFLLSRR
jgi:hypothetical protein